MLTFAYLLLAFILGWAVGVESSKRLLKLCEKANAQAKKLHERAAELNADTDAKMAQLDKSVATLKMLMGMEP